MQLVRVDRPGPRLEETRSLFLDKMAEAVALYRAMGFVETGPYLPQPTPGALCLELSLR